MDDAISDQCGGVRASGVQSGTAHRFTRLRIVQQPIGFRDPFVRCCDEQRCTGRRQVLRVQSFVAGQTTRNDRGHAGR